MNVYKKLQTCRKELKALPVKESGNNKFAGYTYMELGDFLPHIVDLCEAHGLCTVISFGEEATLTVVNSDKPEEKIVFASPMSTAELKGCHAIQNLGAVETYLRRYLYVAAFDIVEHDALDSTNGKQEEPQRPTAAQGPKKVSDAQRSKLFAEMGDGIPKEEHKAWMEGLSAKLKEHFKVESSSDLPAAKFNDVLKWVAEQKSKRPGGATLCSECRQSNGTHAPSCPLAQPE